MNTDDDIGVVFECMYTVRARAGVHTFKYLFLIAIDYLTLCMVIDCILLT